MVTGSATALSQNPAYRLAHRRQACDVQKHATQVALVAKRDAAPDEPVLDPAELETSSILARIEYPAAFYIYGAAT